MISRTVLTEPGTSGRIMRMQALKHGLESSLGESEVRMGLLDGLLGGAIGAGMATVVNDLIAQHGGLQGLVSQFEQKGLGGIMSSWVGTGANQPISAEQIQHALGSSTLGELAAKSGLSMDDLAKKLSSILPQAVDHLTPGGTVPKT